MSNWELAQKSPADPMRIEEKVASPFSQVNDLEVDIEYDKHSKIIEAKPMSQIDVFAWKNNSVLASLTRKRK